MIQTDYFIISWLSASNLLLFKYIFLIKRILKPCFYLSLICNALSSDRQSIMLYHLIVMTSIQRNHCFLVSYCRKPNLLLNIFLGKSQNDRINLLSPMVFVSVSSISISKLNIFLQTGKNSVSSAEGGSSHKEKESQLKSAWNAIIGKNPQCLWEIKIAFSS